MPNGCKQLELSSRRETLTRTEVTVLGLVDLGFSNREIAERLQIGVGTVKWHLHRVFEKLQARNRIEAVATAREHGILPGIANAAARGPSET